MRILLLLLVEREDEAKEGEERSKFVVGRIEWLRGKIQWAVMLMVHEYRQVRDPPSFVVVLRHRQVVEVETLE